MCNKSNSNAGLPYECPLANLATTPGALITPCQALLRVQATMDRSTWSPDTLDVVADILRDAGLRVAEPE